MRVDSSDEVVVFQSLGSWEKKPCVEVVDVDENGDEDGNVEDDDLIIGLQGGDECHAVADHDEYPAQVLVALFLA